MNVARLWVVHFEGVIRTMTVSLGLKIVVQCYNLIHQMQGKQSNIVSLTFAAEKFPATPTTNFQPK